MYKPKRVQREKTRGYKIPLCECGRGEPHEAVFVGRLTRWENVFQSRIGEYEMYYHKKTDRIITPERSLELYRESLELNGILDVHEIRGHDLACWCPLDKPCHADILLKEVNTQS